MGVFSKLKHTKLRTRLLLSYFLACFVPLVITLILLGRYSEKRLEDSIREFTTVYSSQITENVNSFIHDFDMITKSILVDGELLEDLSRCYELSTTEQVEYMQDAKKLMTRAATLLESANSISFYSANGELYNYGISNDPTSASTMVSSDWFLELIQKEEAINITGMHNVPYKLFEDDEARYVTFSRRIYNYEYKYIGTLLVDYKPDDLVKINEDSFDYEFLKNSRIRIWNKDDKLIYDSNLGEPLEEKMIEYSSSTEGNTLRVKIEIPRSNLRFHSKAVGYVALLSSLVGFILVALISLPISKDITSPIRNLQHQMNLAEEGEYEILVEDDATQEMKDLIDNYNKMILKIKQLITDVYLADIKQKNAKLLALQTQINPHMLYNTLEAIRMKALTQGDMEVASMVKALARMFRTMLSTKSTHFVREEVAYTKDYMVLQNVRNPGMYELEVDIPDAILDCILLPMVLQPLVENAIKHGYKGKGDALLIKMVGYKDRDDIVIDVMNNGKVIDDERIAELNRMIEMPLDVQDNDKIGLVNIAERIRLRYGSDYGLKVLSSENGDVCIRIRFPETYEGEDN
jgi:two-component system sensor histidine kinase YesM